MFQLRREQPDGSFKVSNLQGVIVCGFKISLTDTGSMSHTVQVNLTNSNSQLGDWILDLMRLHLLGHANIEFDVFRRFKGFHGFTIRETVRKKFFISKSLTRQVNYAAKRALRTLQTLQQKRKKHNERQSMSN